MLIGNRKLPAMHEEYGKRPQHKCRECCNLRKFVIRKREYYKCAAYGDTTGEGTDWGLNFMACGLFDIPFEGIPLLDRIKSMREVEG